MAVDDLVLWLWFWIFFFDGWGVMVYGLACVTLSGRPRIRLQGARRGPKMSADAVQTWSCP